MKPRKRNKINILFFITDNLNEVKIFLAKTLVYENVNEYTLTLQVRNSPDLVAEAQLVIKVKDVNNLVSAFSNSIIKTFDPKIKPPHNS